jgi:hypothetical protein
MRKAAKPKTRKSRARKVGKRAKAVRKQVAAHDSLPDCDHAVVRAVDEGDRPSSMGARATSALEREIAGALNRHSAENLSDTPDFILAELLVAVLVAFGKASRARSEWYGITKDRPGGGAAQAELPRVFALGDEHTTHVTKAAVRAEREARRVKDTSKLASRIRDTSQHARSIPLDLVGSALGAEHVRTPPKIVTRAGRRYPGQ